MSTLTDLTAALNTATEAMVAKVKVKASDAFHADNADKLGNKTEANLMAGAQAVLAPHASNLGNPHGTTAEQIGAYNTDQIDALIRGRMPRGLLPLARWGTFNADEGDTTVFYSFSNSPLSVSFVAAPALINGTDYTAPDQTINLAPNTKTLLYFALVAGVPKYVSSVAVLAETNTRMYIGSVTTNNSAVNSINIEPVIRIGLHRLSTTAKGSSIPVSGGAPNYESPLLWT